MLQLNDRFFNSHDTADIMTVVSLNRELDGITIMYEDGRTRTFWHLSLIEILIDKGKYVMVPELAPDGWKWCPSCNECLHDFMTCCYCGHRFTATSWMHVRTWLYILKIRWESRQPFITESVPSHRWNR